MIPFWLALILGIVIGILPLVLGIQLAKKLNKNPGPLGGTGAIIGLIVGVAFIFVPQRVYVVTGDMEYSHYVNLWASEYQIEGGSTVSLETKFAQCALINETDEFLIVEEVIYGGYGFGGDTYWVEPKTMYTIDSKTVDYLFDDEPPNEISVSDNSDEITKIWVRNPH